MATFHIVWVSLLLKLQQIKDIIQSKYESCCAIQVYVAVDKRTNHEYTKKDQVWACKVLQVQKGLYIWHHVTQ